MAFLFKFVYVFFLVVFCFVVVVVLQQSSDCSTKVSCLYADTASQQIRNRKVLESREEVKKVVFKKGAKVKRGNIGKKNVGWELRETPLGPDPLHHHGVPQTSPPTLHKFHLTPPN